MATKSAQITDPELQARMEEAYQKLVDSLEQRKNRFFDPSYLAAAQAFATPTKTGSAFEALGNVAGAVNKSQEEEARRDIEINKAKFDINKELLALNQQQKRTQFGMSELADTQPAAPAAGALPGQPPADGGALTSAVGAAPAPGISSRPLEVATQGELPPFTPPKNESEPRPDFVTKPYQPPPTVAGALPPAAPPPAAPPPAAPASTAPLTGPMGLTREGGRIARFAFGDGATLAEAYKKGADYDAVIAQQRNNEQKLRNEEAKLRIDQKEIEIKQAQLENAVEATKQGKYKVVGDALVDITNGKSVYIRGGNKVKIGNETFTGNPDKIDAYVNASRDGDAATVQRVGAELMGLTGEPGVRTVKSEEQKEAEKADRDAKRDAEKSANIKRLEEEDKKRRELIDKIPKFESQRDNATTAIQILGDKEVQKVLGPLAGPGVVKAVGTIISGGLRVGSYNVALANFDEALINIKASPATRVKIDALRTAVRTEELINAQTYLKGDGPITNMERGLVQEMGGMVNKDPAAALLFKIKLSYAQAAVNERYAKSFEVWHDKNPTGTVADFNRSSTYQKIRSDYLVDLESIRKDIGVVPATAAPENKSAATRLRELVKSNVNKLP